jgi:translation elongation factor EF-1beta
VSATSTEADGGDAATTTSTLTVDVAAVNDGPVAVDDAVSTDEDSAVTIDVLGNDTDVDGDSLSVTGATLPDGVDGTVVVNDDGSISFTPGDGFDALGVGESQDVEITYTISDGQGGTDTATATVTVTGTNDGPVAVDDTASATEDGGAVSIDVLGNDTDVDGDSLSVTGATLAEGAEGTVTVNDDGTISFDPGAGYQDLGVGESQDVEITYTIADGQGGTSEATVTVTVEGTNDGPVAVDDSLSGTEDQGITFTAQDLLGNDTDVDGDTLTISSFEQPAGGTIVENDDGSFTFTPDANFNGDTTFTYTVTDGQGGTSEATVTIDVASDADEATITAVDVSGTEDTAIALDLGIESVDTVESISLSGIPDGAVLTDGSGNEITVTDGVADVAPGDLAGLSITPPENSDADFSLTMSVTTVDGDDTATSTSTFDVAVAADADAPTVTATDVSGSEDGSIDLDIASALTDTDGSESLSVTLSGIPDGAVLTDGSGNEITVTDGVADVDPAALSDLSITPPENFNGSFDLTVSATSTEADGGDAATTTSTLTVDVAAVNDGPVAVDDAVSTDEDSAVTIDVLGNDTDVDGDSLSVTGATLPDGVDGTVVVNDDGSISFTPGDGFDALGVGESQDVEITYTISDGQGGTDTATATVTVTGTNDGPVADAGTLDATEDGGAVSGQLTASDVDGMI